MSCVNVEGTVKDTQTALTITLDTCIDLTVGVSSVAISWRDPTGLEGEWAGVVEDITKVSYTLNGTETLSPSGTWAFIAVVYFSNGTVASGSTATERVYKRFEL